ncbi:hypothetical protein ACQEUU_33930 [Nonomuraea sp. CA-218870]|uniref:hypothetical protein n=1 Tax=Nonomuraea sp. CA-218870 TaxID=3239998 RepID=UPI003D916596
MPPPTPTDHIAATYAGHLHTWTGEPGLAGVAAYRIQAELWQGHRVASEVHHGGKVALVSVATELVCWTDGHRWWWWTGRTSVKGHRLYTYVRTEFLEEAAQRVAARYAELQVEQDTSRPATSPQPMSEVSAR